MPFYELLSFVRTIGIMKELYRQLQVTWREFSPMSVNLKNEISVNITW